MSTSDAAGYTLVACGVHDRLEHWAVRGDRVDVVWRDGDGERQAVTTIADVYARGGADWVRLGTGAEVRADRLVHVGDVAISPASWAGSAADSQTRRLDGGKLKCGPVR